MSISNTTCNLAIIKSSKDQINQAKIEIQNLQQQSTSNIKEHHYYDISPSLTEQNIYAEDLIRHCETKKQNYQFMANLLYMQEEAIKSLNDIAESAKILSVRAFDEYGDSYVDLELNSKNLLADIEAILSNKFFGINIWGGAHTNDTPFAKNSLINGKVGSNFYLGNDVALKLHIDGNEFEFGDRADYKCFQHLVNALQQMRDIKDPTTQDSKAILQKVSGLIDEAQDGFIGFMQKVGNVQTKCNQAIDNNDTLMLNISDLYIDSLNGMGDIDRALSVMSITELQNKLSYMFKTTVSLINDMDIFKYI